jgi:hypothetical protein
MASSLPDPARHLTASPPPKKEGLAERFSALFPEKNPQNATSPPHSEGVWTPWLIVTTADNPGQEKIGTIRRNALDCGHKEFITIEGPIVASSPVRAFLLDCKHCPG